MESVVPDEPAADTEDKISTLRIRLPNGSTAHRRFLASNTLQVWGLMISWGPFFKGDCGSV